MTLEKAPLPYDPTLARALATLLPVDLPRPSMDQLPELRAHSVEASVRAQIDARGLREREFVVPGFANGEVTLTVIDRDRGGPPSPCVYFVHGGGMIMGDRWDGLDVVLPWIDRHHLTLVTVEYRLAPEFPDPYPVEDSYAGLQWVAREAPTLGVNAARLVIVGISAGGGIAAGTALLARDRGGPPLLGQMLLCPMMDDRNSSVSAHQYSGTGGWDREANELGWSALLGKRRGSDDVSPYAAPARSTNMANLPPAFIDCGTAEVFRDEDVAYASALWRDGVQAELHAWAGGFHCFDTAVPEAPVSVGAVAARDNWLARVLGAGE